MSSFNEIFEIFNLGDFSSNDEIRFDDPPLDERYKGL
jgi:hypothetical protein